MKINELRLLNIKIFDNGEIVYEGMSENTPTEYKDVPIKIIATGNVVELEILHEWEEGI